MADDVQITLAGKDDVSGVMQDAGNATEGFSRQLDGAMSATEGATEAMQQMSPAAMAAQAHLYDLQIQLEGATNQLQSMQQAYDATQTHTDGETAALERQRMTVETLTAAVERQTEEVEAGAADAEAAMERLHQGAEMASKAIQLGFQGLQGNFKGVVQMIEQSGGAVGAVTGVVNTFVEGISEMTQEYIQTTLETRNLALETGTTTEFLSTMSDVLKENGVNAGVLHTSMIILSRNMGNMEAAADGSVRSVTGLGAVLKDNNITAKDAEQAIYQISDRVKELGPSAEATRLALAAFGRSGAQMIPVLSLGSEELKKQQEEFKTLGLAITQADVDAAQKLKTSQQQMEDRFEAIGRQITRNVVPALNTFTGASLLYQQRLKEANAETDLWKRYMDVAKLSLDSLDGGLFRDAQAQTEAKTAIEEKNKAVEEEAQKQNAYAEAQQKANQAEFEASIVEMTHHEATKQLTAAQNEAISAAQDYTGALGLQYQAHLADSEAADFQGQMIALNNKNLSDGTRELQEYDAALEASSTHANQNAEAMGRAAKATEDLATQQKNMAGAVEGGIGSLPKKLDEAAKAQMAFELATGKTTVGQMENKLAAEALTEAYTKHKITLPQLVEAGQNLQAGFVKNAQGVQMVYTAMDALNVAGIGTNVTLLKNAQDLRDIEKAAGNVTVITNDLAGGMGQMEIQTSAANASALSQLDTWKIITHVIPQATTATKENSLAQSALAGAQMSYNQQTATALANLKNHTFSQQQYNDFVAAQNKTLANATAVYGESTGALNRNDAATEKYVQTLLHQKTVQDAVKQTNTELQELAKHGYATQEDVTRAEIAGQLATQEANKAVTDSKKAFDAANGAAGGAAGSVGSYSTISKGAADNTGQLGKNLQPIPDEMDALAAKAKVAHDALFGLSSTEIESTGGASHLLDPLQRTIQQQQGNIGQLGGTMAKGLGEGFTAGMTQQFRNGMDKAIDDVKKYMAFSNGSSGVTNKSLGVPAGQGVADGFSSTRPTITLAINTTLGETFKASSPIATSTGILLGQTLASGVVTGYVSQLKVAIAGALSDSIHHGG